MKVSDLLANPSFDMNANVRIFAGGTWWENGTEIGYFSCGDLERGIAGMMDANITYMTTDDDGHIIIECDARVDAPALAVPETTCMLTLSTAHIKQSSYELLTTDIDCDLPVYIKTAPNGSSYGLFIYLDPDDEYLGTGKEDVRNVIAYALEKGCHLLCLDSDGPVVDGLKTYEWDE